MKSSRGEIKICDILDGAGLEYKEEFIFPDLMSTNGRPLRFDFAVFDDDGEIDFLIEFQGEQHYHPKSQFGGERGLFQQKFNDNLKREYCRKHGYTLVEVPYWDLSKLNLDYLLKAAYQF